MGVITVLYLGIVVVTIGTRTYGSSQQDHVSIAQLLSQGMGIDATGVAAVLAVVISLGTANAYIAAISRLGYALARDGAFPSWMGGLDRKGVPIRAVLCVGACASGGLVVTLSRRMGCHNALCEPKLAQYCCLCARYGGRFSLTDRESSLAGRS